MFALEMTGNDSKIARHRRNLQRREQPRHGDRHKRDHHRTLAEAYDGYAGGAMGSAMTPKYDAVEK